MQGDAHQTVAVSDQYMNTSGQTHPSSCRWQPDPSDCSSAAFSAPDFRRRKVLWTTAAADESSYALIRRDHLSTEAWAIVVTIAVAVSGYVVTYFMQRHQAQRQARLERINCQLRNLYGPLYSILKANQAVWNEFRDKLWPKHGHNAYFHGNNTTDAENERWRIWMTEVFEPLNARIERIILENGDLLIDSELPQEFVDALAHIASYRALYPKWKDGDFTIHTSLINFPDGLLPIIEHAYRKLLQQQKNLTG